MEKDGAWRVKDEPREVEVPGLEIHTIYYRGQSGPCRYTSGELPALKGVSLKKEGQVALRAAELECEEIT